MRQIRKLLPASAVVAAMALAGCAGRRVSVVPALTSPDGSPPAWVELLPGMRLRIEGAYYREGSPRRGLADYLGSETVTYEVRPDGRLRLEAVSSFLASKPEERQPRDQPAVQTLIHPRHLAAGHHRLFFQVVMSRSDAIRPAVLIGSRSAAELDRLTARFIATGSSACGPGAIFCTAFPPLCTASIEIGIVINGTARQVVWGTTIGGIAAHPAHVELLRRQNGRLASVPVDVSNPDAMRIRLLHGDRLNWD